MKANKTKTKQNQKKTGKDLSKKNRALVKAPAAQSRGNMVLRPWLRMHPAGESIRIKHREFISNVSNSENFLVMLGIELNPGIPFSFPWLSIMANNWDQYKFHSLKFHLITRSGTTTVGSVILAPDYDSTDKFPINEQVICSYVDTVEDVPWKDQLCILNPKSMAGGMSRKFIRSLPLPSDQDIKTYDSGRLFVAAVGGPAGPPLTVGKLWVEYDVELFVPSMHSTGNALSASGTTPGGVGVSNSSPFGTAPTLVSNSQGFAFGEINKNILTIQSPGDYLLTTQHNGTALSSVAPPTIVAGSGQVTNQSQGISPGGSVLTQVVKLINMVAGSQILFGNLTGTSTNASAFNITKAITGSI